MEHSLTITPKIKEIQRIVNEFCSTVYSTLGPGGKNVIIDVGEHIPIVTKDGVTVAEHINYKDPLKNAIASLIKEAARTTAQEVGDGTTTSTLLAGYIINKGFDNILANSNISIKNFFDGMDEAMMMILDHLTDSTVPIEDNLELLKAIVKISSNSDDEITSLIMEAVDKSGTDGIINVKASNELTSSISSTNGASIDSKVFTHEPGESEQGYLVLVEGDITKVSQILPILNASASVLYSNSAVVIVAKEFTEKVLKVIDVNNQQNKTRIVAVEAEGFGSNRLRILKDMRLLTGVEILSTDKTTKLDIADFDTSHMVGITNLIYTPTELIFTPILQDGYSLAMTREIESLKEQYNQAKTEADSANLTHIKRRLSKFTNVATIEVGGTTQGEMIEREARVTDAVCAVTAAMNGGVVPGGGKALLNAAVAFEKHNKSLVHEADNFSGMNTILAACKTPIRTLCDNMGLKTDDLLSLSDLEPDNATINMISGDIVNAYDSGILDPSLVVSNALKNAVSVAKTILKASSFIVPDNA